VHSCSQQRGRPGLALADYSREDIERERLLDKACAPTCSLSCVHQVAFLDEVRKRPREMLHELIEMRRANDPAFTTPWILRAAAWAFLENRQAAAFGRVAARLFGLRRDATRNRPSYVTAFPRSLRTWRAAEPRGRRP
jgi:hypothetical protein